MGAFSKLHPQFRPWAEWIFRVAEANNLAPRVTSGYRSISDQRRLYNRWLRGANPYPVAYPGTSRHNYGLAIDMVSRNNPALGGLWQHYGGRWGGKTDPVHFDGG